MPTKTNSDNVVERFLKKVRKTDSCWLWIGGKSSSGYGSWIYGGRNRMPHRESYALFVGPIPKGMCVCHKCDVKLCVNPDHFFIGTVGDNTRDAIAKGLRPANQVMPGESNPNARFTWADIDDMRRSYPRLNFPQLAKKYGTTKSTVRNIVRGLRWKRTSEPLSALSK